MSHIRIFTTLLSIVGMLLTSAAFAAPSDGTVAVGPQVHKASAVIGSRVENTQGETLGLISDIVLDPEAGRIKYVALSYGGILGLGGKLFAVSWDALTLQPDGKAYLLNVDRELLNATSGFDKSNWPQWPDPMLRQRPYQQSQCPQAQGLRQHGQPRVCPDRARSSCSPLLWQISMPSTAPLL